MEENANFLFPDIIPSFSSISTVLTSQWRPFSTSAALNKFKVEILFIDNSFDKRDPPKNVLRT